MKKYLKHLFILSSFVCTTSASAAWDNGGVSTTIAAVTVLQDGTFYIQAEADLCDVDTNKVGRVYLGDTPNGMAQTSDGIKMLLSVAISAQVTQSKVRVYADDSGNEWGCRMGAIKILN